MNVLWSSSVQLATWHYLSKPAKLLWQRLPPPQRRVLALAPLAASSALTLTAIHFCMHPNIRPFLARWQLPPGTPRWYDVARYGVGGHIPVVTTETRRSEFLLDMDGIPGIKMCNAAVGLPPRSFVTKNEMFLAWAERELEEHGDHLAIFVDAGDMWFGNCSEEELLQGYRLVVSASGEAPVLMSAELDPYPNGDDWDTHRYDELLQRKRAVLQATGLGEQPAWESFDKADCLRACPPKYAYTNYGFIMGPLAAVKILLEGVVKSMVPTWLSLVKKYFNSKKVITSTDQGQAAKFMFSHPDLVTLDYSMSVVASIGLFKSGALIDMQDGKLINKITQQVQCFVHGNGAGKQELARLREHWKNASAI